MSRWGAMAGEVHALSKTPRCETATADSGPPGLGRTPPKACPGLELFPTPPNAPPRRWDTCQGEKAAQPLRQRLIGNADDETPVRPGPQSLVERRPLDARGHAPGTPPMGMRVGNKDRREMRVRACGTSLTAHVGPRYEVAEAAEKEVQDAGLVFEKLCGRAACDRPGFYSFH
ncbi:hypothetical protein HPB50_001355 [Hyalomma asiaticum]|uniref:Uncharacterized protein n=1 Tax=Hyalomma asiaticum TaxID=266040 RepID=A0ACB7SM29_HYAAI|nr:hypothetical protein HPB50_001355 [Hyalomma asiaticum]